MIRLRSTVIWRSSPPWTMPSTRCVRPSRRSRCSRSARSNRKCARWRSGCWLPGYRSTGERENSKVSGTPTSCGPRERLTLIRSNESWLGVSAESVALVEPALRACASMLQRRRDADARGCVTLRHRDRVCLTRRIRVNPRASAFPLCHRLRRSRRAAPLERAPGEQKLSPILPFSCNRAQRSYDSRRADADTLIRYLPGSVQKSVRSSERLDAPP